MLYLLSRVAVSIGTVLLNDTEVREPKQGSCEMLRYSDFKVGKQRTSIHPVLARNLKSLNDHTHTHTHLPAGPTKYTGDGMS